MSKSNDLAIVLVSGGMDSCLSAAIANEAHENLAFLHLNYGQNTEKKELECFHASVINTMSQWKEENHRRLLFETNR